MNLQICFALAKDAELLSQIAFFAKTHWGYPTRWMEIWKPQLTFSPGHFRENESWVAERNGEPIAFYTLLEKDGNEWIENL